MSLWFYEWWNGNWNLFGPKWQNPMVPHCANSFIYGMFVDNKLGYSLKVHLHSSSTYHIGEVVLSVFCQNNFMGANWSMLLC